MARSGQHHRLELSAALLLVVLSGCGLSGAQKERQKQYRAWLDEAKLHQKTCEVFTRKYETLSQASYVLDRGSPKERPRTPEALREMVALARAYPGQSPSARAMTADFAADREDDFGWDFSPILELPRCPTVTFFTLIRRIFAGVEAAGWPAKARLELGRELVAMLTRDLPRGSAPPLVDLMVWTSVLQEGLKPKVLIVEPARRERLVEMVSALRKARQELNRDYAWVRLLEGKRIAELNRDDRLKVAHGLRNEFRVTRKVLKSLWAWLEGDRSTRRR